MKKLSLVVFYLISLALTAAFSARIATKNQMVGFDAQLFQVQGVHAYNQLQRFRELENDLVKGCTKVALEKTKISAAVESTLLASHLKNNPQGWLHKYVSDRSPGLVEKLATYESPYGTSWQEPRCK